MADRLNPYEAAFEAYVRHHEIPCIATRENSRSFPAWREDKTLKSLDFIIFGKKNPVTLPWEIQHSAESGEDFRIIQAEETKKELLSQVSLQNISWLVDIKGRRFPSGQKQKQFWANWVTEDDLISLTRWENIFGKNYFGLLVFVYLITGDLAPLEQSRLFSFRDQLFAFIAVPLSTYRTHCRPRSTRWQTVSMPVNDFRQHAIPLDEMLGILN